MDSITHREYRTRLKWLQSEWNNPSRSDHYLMRVAQRVQQVLSSKPNKIGVDDQKLDFDFGGKKKTPKESVTQTKSRWMRQVSC